MLMRLEPSWSHLEGLVTLEDGFATRASKRRTSGARHPSENTVFVHKRKKNAGNRAPALGQNGANMTPVTDAVMVKNQSRIRDWFRDWAGSQTFQIGSLV